jgi:O-antigen ligase
MNFREQLSLISNTNPIDRAMSANISQLARSKSKFQTFLDRYQYILSIVVTFLFFSEIPDYLGDENKILPINTLTWINVCLVLSLPFIKKLRTIPKSLVIAMSVFLLVSFMSLVTINANDLAIQELRKRFLAVVFVCMMYVLYQQKSLKHIKYTILTVVLMSVANNFYELFNPGVFSNLNVGRPAGFYVNPTKTGCALLLGMIFTVNLFAKRYRLVYVLLVGLAILITFTRGAILGWIVCVGLMIVGRVLSDKPRSLIVPISIAIVLVATVNPLQLVGNYFSGGLTGSYSNVLIRLEQFQNPSLDDASARERNLVAKFAWKMFGDRPFWGHGLSSTNTWDVADVSTHNMYLYYMVDHGIIGLLFLPGAIFAVVYRNRGEEKIILLCYATFMSLWGLFSHNIFGERYILIPFALLSAMDVNARWYLKYNTRNFQLALPPARAQLVLPPARSRRSLPPVSVVPNRKRLLLPPPRETNELPPKS